MKLIFLILFPFASFAQVVVKQNGQTVTTRSTGISITIGLPVGTPNTFNFGPYSDSVTTSAGVYKVDGADTVLVRTLWSAERYGPGTYVAQWDGKDDTLGTAPTGNYHVKVLSHNVTYTWDGARIGNTSTALTGSSVHEARSPTCIAVGGGNLYYGSGYQEKQYAQYVVNLNTIGARTRIINSDTHTGQSTYSVCSDGNYVYWGGGISGISAATFIFATKVGDNTRVEFDSGISISAENSGGYGSFDYSGIAVSEVSNPIQSIAVQKLGSYLFVSRPTLNKLQVYNKNTGAFVRDVTFTGIGYVACDTSGKLWLSYGTVIEKYTVNTNGTITSTGLTLSGITQPGAMTVSPNNSTVAVIDLAINQQVVKGFSNSEGGGAVWTLGTPGGYSIDATVTDYKFFFNAPLGAITPSIAYQANGALWVQDGNNCRIQRYNSSRIYTDNIMFTGGNLYVQTDHADSSRLYIAGYREFKLNYLQTIDNGQNGSWKLYKNWSGGLTGGYDEQTQWFGNDIFTIQDHTYFTRRTPDNAYDLYELVVGGIARKTKISGLTEAINVLPDGGDRVIDLYGYHVGESSQYNVYSFIGFDNDNDPLWANSPSEIITSPIATTEDATSLAYKISGNKVYYFQANRLQNDNTNYHLAAFKRSNSKWTFKVSPGTSPYYIGPFPAKGEFDNGNGVNQAGSTFIINNNNIFWNYRGEFWKQVQTNFYNHYHTNGLFIGQFGVAKPNNETETNPPGSDGNVLEFTFVQATTDKGYIIHGGEGVFAGIHRWSLTGLNTIQIQNSNFNPALNYIPPPVGLMVGLKHGSSDLGNSGWVSSNPNSSGTETDWSVYTGTYTASKYGIQDISTYYRGANGRTLTRVLPVVQTTNNWTLSCRLNLENNDPVREGINGGSYVEVLDNTGKIIAQFRAYKPVPFDQPVQVDANGVVLHSFPNEYEGGVITKQEQPFSITNTNGTLTFRYAGYAATANSVVESGANVSRPTTFRLRFTPGDYQKAISVANLQFTTP